MIIFEAKNWRRFGATKARPVLRRWLKAVLDESQAVFRAGMAGRHTGRIYRRRGGRLHQASVNRAGAEYPANDSGRLMASMKRAQKVDEATLGTDMYYAKFLAEGTRKMKRRRMSKEALMTGGVRARPKSKGWVKWARSNRARKERSLND